MYIIIYIYIYITHVCVCVYINTHVYIWAIWACLKLGYYPAISFQASGFEESMRFKKLTNAQRSGIPVPFSMAWLVLLVPCL